MTAVLLDTHVLVWSLFDRQLSSVARDAIEKASKLLVSAVSLYEIDSKRRYAGAARAADLVSLPVDLMSFLPAAGYELLDITPHQAWLAANLPFAHGDPWDRILVAQARDLGVPLVTRDKDLRDIAGDTPVIW